MGMNEKSRIDIRITSGAWSRSLCLRQGGTSACGTGSTYGYVVVAYEGNGLTRISLEKTPYLFDLKANWEAVMAGLKEAGIDPDSAEASRVRIADENTEGTAEAVRITDDSGNSCLFRFDEEGVVFLTEEAPE